MRELRRKLNIFFRTHANHHVLTKGWKYDLHMLFVKMTDERK